MNLTDINNNQVDNNHYVENVESDNCFIEGLRIELETALGFSLFKMVYNIIEDNVIKFFNSRLIHINSFVILIF